MPKDTYDIGSSSVILGINFLDSRSTTGAGLTGLTTGTAGLKCSYLRNRGMTAPQVLTLDTIVTIGTYGTYATNHAGFKEVDNVNQPGEYQFHAPNAAFASGCESVTFWFVGAANMVPLQLEIELRDADAEYTAIANMLLKMSLLGITGESRWSVLNALRFLLNEKTPDVNNTYLSVKKEGTSAAEAYRVNIVKDASAAPITRMVPQP